MKTLTKLAAAEATDAEHRVMSAQRTINVEAMPGHFVHVRITPEVIVLQHGTAIVAIPMLEIIRMASEHHPALLQPGGEAKPE